MAFKTLLLLGLSFAIVLLIASEVAAKDMAEPSTTSTSVSVDKSNGAVKDKSAVKYVRYDQGYERYPGGGYEGYPGGGYEGGRGGYESGRGRYEGGRGGYESGRGRYEGGRGGYEGGLGGFEGDPDCYYGYCGNRCCNAAEVGIIEN